MISTPLDSELLVILPRFVAEMMDGGGGGGGAGRGEKHRKAKGTKR